MLAPILHLLYWVLSIALQLLLHCKVSQLFITILLNVYFLFDFQILEKRPLQLLILSSSAIVVTQCQSVDRDSLVVCVMNTTFVNNVSTLPVLVIAILSIGSLIQVRVELFKNQVDILISRYFD